jgi:hypothetical protein
VNDYVEKLPWKNDDKNRMGCNFAYADLRNNLPRLLTINGKIHAETFVAASGAIAGFAAQQALLAQRPNFSIEELNDSSTNDGLSIVRSPRGDRYLDGDPLKAMVFCNWKPTPTTARLWEWAAGGAVDAGLDKSEMPDTLAMWEHVNRSIQGDLEGMPSVPKEHWPHLAPAQLLERLWPIAKLLLIGKGSGARVPSRIGLVVEPHWWPTITGMATGVAIQQVKTDLDPRTALIIAMETAIFTLKVDPAKIREMKTDLDPRTALIIAMQQWKEQWKGQWTEQPLRLF